ncbi:hypothetical protein CcrC1_gp132 [Caulobacter phage C1]|nr:hypothetical protein CcrC1_gp132 [Caulobacter phage C1]UTU08361.1 hypothetical protein CcrC2_gp133 [Caulobacter phage C2]UTU08878.1 hypothetical protein CcrJ4_gp127 [Caulobacter phage J4]UTU09434.1 hypothetical protein CcrBL47_gp148 [Caulobacter phage BL47]UTU09994.1 hypothetical protein CcrRB23_gp132 [Caulobacter phage RB23]WGN97019.1 hypothetical protein [Bertelyvirus sp.]
MKSRDFCYWLQGLFELQNPVVINETQTRLIKAHLNMVFTHEIDPSFPAAQQAALNADHEAGKKPASKNNGFFEIVDSGRQEGLMRC